MAQVSMSFTINGNKKILGAINSMAVAIEDTGFYGADFDYEEDGTSLESNVENLDLQRLSSYGVVRRNGQEKMVIIDFGLTEDVFNNYYRKSRE